MRIKKINGKNLSDDFKPKIKKSEENQLMETLINVSLPIFAVMAMGYGAGHWKILGLVLPWR